jgi:hypothetical protein
MEVDYAKPGRAVNGGTIDLRGGDLSRINHCRGQ